ncbi:hypothetical protein HRbin23_00285 [bacterium HR23]|nr:hypothetical protein HRbin23_00285 [bacterium HR23]
MAQQEGVLDQMNERLNAVDQHLDALRRHGDIRFPRMRRYPLS